MINWFADILYDNPQKDSEKWSLDDGLCVKRQSVGRKEKSFEAYGLIDGMPTGGHWESRVYDDIINQENVTSPEMIQKSVYLRKRVKICAASEKPSADKCCRLNRNPTEKHSVLKC
jgi:hypothetical protein